ncbi:hypothetical protein JHD49_02605 [Sulfurimonas sp. SAG-AH-194-C21]|nr:hypothetical protein [Sulfurimonas sp. SAG-AH-194-C21]MDF1882824.1 hypothetical protein [Sulfurimonas sp. SAG-AH-194-C21]
MKINKTYFFIITLMLTLSLFNVGFSSLILDESSKTATEISLEKDLLEKDAEKKKDKMTLATFFNISNLQKEYNKQTDIENHYSYLDINQLLKPPRYTYLFV